MHGASHCDFNYKLVDEPATANSCVSVETVHNALPQLPPPAQMRANSRVDGRKPLRACVFS
jgi:hypothetical protein